MTPADVIEAFGRLKTGSRSGQRLPHKPLLVLLALGRWARGDYGPIPFADVEKQPTPLLQTYGPPGAGNPQEPFWRLRRDGVWELGGTEHLASPDAVTPPGLKDLRAGVTGWFSQGVRQALDADPGLINRLARSVLEAHFPPSLQPDIADAVGLDLAVLAPSASATAKQKVRDVVEPKFVSLHGNFFGQEWFTRTGKQTTNLASINKGILRRFPVPIAPRNEQRRIVAKVEELFSDLDAGVASLERARANLMCYRAAVLKAAVEGTLTEECRATHPDTEPASELLERILAERRRRWEADQLAKFAAADKAPPRNWQAKYVEPAVPDTSTLPELPPCWCWAKTDQCITFLKNGYFQSPSPATDGHRILRINAVRPMQVNLGEVRFLPSVGREANDYLIENGDLLFTRYNGSLDLLGVAGMVRGCSEPTLHPDKLIRVKVASPPPLAAYLELACNVGESRKHIAGRARTTGGQTGISGTDIRETPIPLPPTDEEAEIVAEVERRLSVIAAAEGQVELTLHRAARLRQSILKAAFAGSLAPQDPEDEPASELLERIRRDRARADATSPAQANSVGRRRKQRGVKEDRT